jgi:hypothetical protein
MGAAENFRTQLPACGGRRLMVAVEQGFDHVSHPAQTLDLFVKVGLVGTVGNVRPGGGRQCV